MSVRAPKPHPHPASPTALVADAHARPIDDVLAALDTRRSGLSDGEAARRLACYGPNSLPHAEPPSLAAVFFHQFRSPLIYILLVAAIVAFALGDASDAGFILLVLAINAAIGTAQEYRAEQSAAALRSMVTTRAAVIRDGEEREIDAEWLVPGDIVALESGAKVPADLRLVTSGLEVDESLLTGESLAVAKRADDTCAPAATIGDRATMAFAGTLVTRGRAYGVVVATGMHTQIGKIAVAVVGTQSAKPPLLLRMERFTTKIAVAIAVAVIALGVVSLLKGASLAEVFMLSVALAVSAIPEGLPVALTVTLAVAVRRMSRRQVIARRLAAVETLGSCTFIASDKTGTLTVNELTVKRILLPGRPPWEVAGEGLTPVGPIGISPACDDASERARVRRLSESVALCNDGTLARRDGTWIGHGDAVDVALLVLAEKDGVSRPVVETAHPRLASLPFEAERQFAVSVNQYPHGAKIFVKGAGERVLAMCDRMATSDGDVAIDRGAIEREAAAVAGAGYRLLAVAEGNAELPRDGQIDPAALGGLVLLGFVAMLDPLRPEARQAIEACRGAGIEVAMVTGDHPITALAIASELGMANRSADVVTGTQLRAAASAGTDALDALVRRGRVFARVEPQQKLEIVQSLIRLGHFVAVTGDGANDAPALRAAHIGVAMGKRGTDVARETAELIVTDDNFASIVAGIEEGRVAYANVRKVIFLLVSMGAAELLLFVLAAAFATPLPLLPVQLLWLNLVTNGIQDVALALEPGEGGELRQPPRPPREPIFNRLMLERTLISAVVVAGVSFSAFYWMLAQGWTEASARNGILLLLVLFENVQAGNARSETQSLLRLSPLRNRTLLLGTVIAQLVHIGAMYMPGLREILRLETVPFEQWVVSLGLAVLLFIAIEAHKLIRFRGPRRALGAPDAGMRVPA